VYFYTRLEYPLKPEAEEGNIMGQMLCAVLILLLAAVPLAALAVETGGKAPDFEAESTMGTVKLSDYLGRKNVLLAFYFKDFTGG
jgi:peroxiredoxin Q/BCP